METLRTYRKLFSIFVLGLIIAYIPLWIAFTLIWVMINRSEEISTNAYIITNGFAFLTYVLFFYRYGRFIGEEESGPLQSDYSFSNENDSSLTNDEEIKVSGYGSVRPCCYNAARLEDTYCMCGRAIPEALRSFIHES
jgi:hypothetical protein